MGFGQCSYNSAERRNPLKVDSQSRGKRVRQVFNSDEIPHLWAHQTQSSARNQQGNFYFDGPTIYSYGSHFPIASHVRNRQGDKAILFNTDSYGPTTGRQVNYVTRSIPSGTTKFKIGLDSYMLPDNSSTMDASEYDRVIAWYQTEIQSLARKAIEARTTKKIQEWLDSAQSELKELLRFVEFFGLPKLSKQARIPSRKLPSIPASVDAAKELGRAAKQRAAKEAKLERERKAAAYLNAAKKWMENNPTYAARWDGTIFNAKSLFKEHRQADEDKRALVAITVWMSGHTDVSAQWDGTLALGKTLESAWKIEDALRRNAETIARWLANESVSAYSLPHNIPTMLRIVGDSVQTSMGATFPVSHARKGLTLVQAVIARGQEWNTNGHTCHLGNYKIERIEANGTVHAGCHVVTWEAIQRIAPVLLASPDISEVQPDCEEC